MIDEAIVDRVLNPALWAKTAYENEPCFWCGIDLSQPRQDKQRSPNKRTRDHVLPKCDGGTVTVWCCNACNSIKGNIEPQEWVEFISTAGPWRHLFHKPGPRGRDLYDRWCAAGKQPLAARPI